MTFKDLDTFLQQCATITKFHFLRFPQNDDYANISSEDETMDDEFEFEN